MAGSKNGGDPKTRGFMTWPRTEPPKRSAKARVQDYSELYAEDGSDRWRPQSGRCMDCGVPFCQQGCPLGNPIPDFNELVFRGRWEAAYRRLRSTNNFPEFTGRLCPAPCEAACVLNINDDPVTIEAIEKDISDRAWAAGLVRPQPPRMRSGKTVAVVGSGPAGLAAADQLNRAGHRVTVIERDDRIGGLLRYGIPDFKMERQVLDRRLEVMRAEGVTFETGVDVGGTVSWNELRLKHDALVIAIGSRLPRDLKVPGRELDGVLFAMDFLEAQNRVVAGDIDVSPVSAQGKHVIILGGGDTGSDCLGTALRQGAASVTQVELLQRPPAVRAESDPWPRWPVVFRTSSSQAEGGDREWALMTTELVGESGQLKELHAVRVDTSMAPVPDSEAVVERCDMLLLAMGYVGPEAAVLQEQLGVQLDGRGNIVADRDLATNVPGVFVAGDAQRGQSLIVWAISDGREAARSCDAFLSGRHSGLGTRGKDRPFA